MITYGAVAVVKKKFLKNLNREVGGLVMTTESKVTIKAGNVEISSGLLRSAYLIRIYKENGDRIGDIVSQHTLKK